MKRCAHILLMIAIATAATLQTSCKKEEPAKPVLIGLELTQTELTLTEGDEAVLTAQLDPADFQGAELLWSSTNEAAATVDQNGKVTAVAEGKTKIKVTAPAWKLEAVCEVTVKKLIIPVTGISFNTTELTVNARTEKDLKEFLTILPENASNKSPEWSSSDSETISVDQNGKIKAKKTGKAKITARIAEDSKEFAATIKIEVISDLKIASSKDYGFHGSTMQFTSNYQNMTWSVEGEKNNSRYETRSTINKQGLLTFSTGNIPDSSFPGGMRPKFEDHKLIVTGTNEYGETATKEIDNYTWKIALCKEINDRFEDVGDWKEASFGVGDLVHARVICSKTELTKEDLDLWTLEWGAALLPVESTAGTLINKVGPILEVQEGGNTAEDIDQDDYRIFMKLGNVTSKSRLINIGL